MTNNTAHNKTNEKVKSAAIKMLADKAAWMECVRQNKPLSTLKEKDIILLKLG